MIYTFGPFTALKAIHFPTAFGSDAWVYGVAISQTPSTPQVETNNVYFVDGLPPFLTAAEVALIPSWNKQVSKGPAGKTFSFGLSSVGVRFFTQAPRSRTAQFNGVDVVLTATLIATPPKPTSKNFDAATNAALAKLSPRTAASASVLVTVAGPNRVFAGSVTDPELAGAATLVLPFL